MELAAEDLDPDTPGGDAVYDFVRRAADWAGLLPPGGTFSVNSHVWDCSQLNNSVLVRVLPRETVRPAGWFAPCDTRESRRTRE